MDAGIKKEKRNNRGTHPNSMAALIPVAKGEVRSPNGRGKGVPERRTAYELGFNPRGAKDFDLGVEHRALFEYFKGLLESILKSITNEKGEIVLFHSSDIEMRYEKTIFVKNKPKIVQTFGLLSDVCKRLEETTGITILSLAATKDLIKDALATGNQLRQILSDINDVQGNKKAPEVNIDYDRKERQFEIRLRRFLAMQAEFRETGQFPTEREIFETFKSDCEDEGIPLTELEIKRYDADINTIDTIYAPIVRQKLQEQKGLNT